MAGTETGKRTIGVIMGGLSSEREVSLESGRNIFSKMDRRRFDPVPIFMDSRGRLWEIPLKLLMRNSTRDIEEDLAEEAKPLPYESLRDRVSLVFLGLHGKYGEDGCMQGLLELLRIPYTGAGVLASAIGMDKFAARRILVMHGIDVPRTVAVERKNGSAGDREDILARIETEIAFPCVVKPSREGCSTAVKKVVSPPGSLAWKRLRWDPGLVEEWMRA
jgi:D-alanine-D-alanine ligase